MGPAVRIRFAPAGSLQTFGPSRVAAIAKRQRAVQIGELALKQQITWLLPVALTFARAAIGITVARNDAVQLSPEADVPAPLDRKRPPAQLRQSRQTILKKAERSRKRMNGVRPGVLVKPRNIGATSQELNSYIAASCCSNRISLLRSRKYFASQPRSLVEPVSWIWH